MVNITFLFVKGTVSVISSVLHSKMAMPDLQRYPRKLLYELAIHFYFHLLCHCKSFLRISCYYETMEKFTEINTS